MDAICSSETSVDYQRTARPYIPEDSHNLNPLQPLCGCSVLHSTWRLHTWSHSFITIMSMLIHDLNKNRQNIAFKNTYISGIQCFIVINAMQWVRRSCSIADTSHARQRVGRSDKCRLKVIDGVTAVTSPGHQRSQLLSLLNSCIRVHHRRPVVNIYTTCSTTVVFNLFCSRTPRYNFSWTLYPQSCWCIIQVIHSL
jgi:hypothetical protein